MANSPLDDFDEELAGILESIEAMARGAHHIKCLICGRLDVCTCEGPCAQCEECGA